MLSKCLMHRPHGGGEEKLLKLHVWCGLSESPHTSHLYSADQSRRREGHPQHQTSHFISLKAWASFRRNTEGKGRVVMTRPYGTHPLLLLAISGQSVGMTTRLADPATSCLHPCVRIARHSHQPPLASMVGGLFSCSLTRQQAAGGMSL